jgi:integrase
MRLRLTEEFVASAKATHGREREVFWDTRTECFGLVVTAAGHRAFIVQYRANGVSRRFTFDVKRSLEAARKEAKALLGQIAKGGDPVADRHKVRRDAANTLKSIGERYLQREEQRGELRSIGETRRVLERNVFPALGHRPIDSIKRSEIMRLLDRIEDDSGPSMADHALAAVRRVMNWHAARVDSYNPPIQKGMAKTKPAERARQRVLSDIELRVVWKAAGSFPGPYGHLLRFIVLTAARLREAARMHRQEVTGDTWLIPAERHKSKREFLLPLSKFAQEVLAGVPAIGAKGVVFTTDTRKPVAGFSKFKRQFDDHVLAVLREADPKAKPLSNWVVHDLRRTARSLLSRAGVSPDHAERCLGHVIGGVRGVYDRHAFEVEKMAGFEALAVLVARIIEPPGQNVVELRQRG